MKNVSDQNELLQCGSFKKKVDEGELSSIFRTIYGCSTTDLPCNKGRVAWVDELLRNYWESSPHLFIMKKAAIRHLDKGEVLFWQGDLCDKGYFLLSGAITIRSSREGVITSITKIEEGEFFQVNRAAAGERRQGTAVSSEPSEVALLDKELLEQSLQRDDYLKNLFKAKRLLQEKRNDQRDNKEYLCNCMRVKKEEVIACIERGCSEIEKLADQTGAGAVCGSCRPAIKTLMGIEAWDEASLVDLYRHSDAIHSYKIRPSSGVSEALAGQHIVVEGIVHGSAVSRCYTLTDVDRKNNTYEIAVKREEKGLFSNWLFENEERSNIPLRVSKPEGNFLYPSEEDGPIVFLTAGVGITPTIAFIREWIREGKPRDFYLDYSYRREDKAIFRTELSEWDNQYDKLRIFHRQTERMSRLDKNELSRLLLLLPDAKFYICGPQNYQKEVTNRLYSLGVATERVAVEEFIPKHIQNLFFGKEKAPAIERS